ncbi:MAG: flagellar hook-length control protein FliK, partial [Rheinheimera sp.]|nr:flagellar hook-length control protein FliK [Rheinheimera sp.]
KNPIKQALLASEAKADVAIAAAPSQSGQALHSGQALSSGQAIDAAAFTQAADGELTGVDENAQHSIAQPADTQGINAAKTADNAQKTADVAAVTTGNGMLTPQPVTGAGDITPVAAAISAHEPGSLSADVKTPSSILQAEKATVKAGAESLASGAKPGNNEQHGQQQPRQNSASTQQLDAQPLLAEPHTLTTKASTDTTSANRFETVFANNLHAQEQRQHSALSQSQAKSATEQLTQNLNLQQQDGAGQLRERVNLMVRQNIQVAEIRLDPAGLGKMQIKLDMQQDQAQVQFIVQQSQAKELLEQQLPRLRELLQQQGIVLTEGNVQQQSQQQERQLAQRQGDGGRAGQQAQSGDDETDTAATAVQITARHSEQLVDYYA